MTLSLFSLNMGHVSWSHACIALYTQVNKALKGGNILYIKYSLREAFIYVLADFVRQGGPPTPLTENQCEKKKDFFLSGIGG